jgi:hypothetical protein
MVSQAPVVTIGFLDEHTRVVQGCHRH